MPIEYAVVPNPLTSPASYAPRVVTKDTVRATQLAPRIAERTAQTPEAVQAVLTALSEEALLVLLGGQAFLFDEFLQVTPTLSGKIESPAADLPEDATPGLSARVSSTILERFKSGAKFTRVSADNIAPEILELAAVNGELTALRSRDILEIRGNRLGVDSSISDEGVFFVPTAGGEAIRATQYLDEGDKRLRLIVPEGLAPAAKYLLRIDARRTANGTLRSTTWGEAITAN